MSSDPDSCFNSVQVWYCVPPGKPRERFEALAASLFPDEARECKVRLLRALNHCRGWVHAGLPGEPRNECCAGAAHVEQ